MKETKNPKKGRLKQMVQITHNQCRELLYRHRTDESTIFSIKFVKRSDRSERSMLCRFNVKKHLKGGTQPYNPSDYDLITVFEMGVAFDPKTGKPPYKCIPMDAVYAMKMGGVEYQIIG